ncbi:MAG: LPS export ABC transporter permease LptG [Syntrophaceae bacterium]
MTILDRYVSKEFIRFFVLILALFITLFVIVEFFEKSKFFLSRNATSFQIVSYLFYMIPMMASHTIPASVLLASLITFSSLSKNSEIIAMKANGISLYRISLPVIIISILICIIAFLNSEFIMPYSNQKALYIRKVEVQKRELRAAFKQNQIWYRGKDGFYNFKLFDPRTNTLQGITINYLDKDFTLKMRIDADKAEWKDEQWTFYNLLITRFTESEFPSLEHLPSKVIDLPEHPSDFNVVQKDANSMGYAELRKYVDKIQSEGYDATQYIVDLHGKIAFTLVSIILVIIGISFSLMKTERSGGIMQSIGIGIFIGFSYWLVHAFAMSLGRSGSIPPFLSAWFANFLWGAASIVMFLRVKT